MLTMLLMRLMGEEGIKKRGCNHHSKLQIKRRCCISEQRSPSLDVVDDARAQLHCGGEGKASGRRWRHVRLQDGLQGIQDIVLTDLAERKVWSHIHSHFLEKTKLKWLFCYHVNFLTRFPVLNHKICKSKLSLSVIIICQRRLGARAPCTWTGSVSWQSPLSSRSPYSPIHQQATCTRDCCTGKREQFILKPWRDLLVSQEVHRCLSHISFFLSEQTGG